MNAATSERAQTRRRGAPAPPRLGFLGAGWIGRARMASLANAGLAMARVVADPDPAARRLAAEAVPGITAVDDLESLLQAELDGVVIATPNALHAVQAIAALERGMAVFCQKPLARDAAETRAVVDAARRADRLLGIDLSYRHLAAVTAARRAIAGGQIGRPYAAELVFHNGYGPDKAWFADRAASGGGCLIDLGIHLVDLLLWLTGDGSATVDAARLRHRGRPLTGALVEDLALAELTTDGGVIARLACSWHMPVGGDCMFEASVYGSDAAVSVRNVAGSFYDFTARLHRGTASELLTAPPDDWGPRALAGWARALAADGGFDPAAEEAVALARVLDDIYAVAT